MKKYWYKTKFDLTDAVLKDWIFPKPVTLQSEWVYKATEILSPQFISKYKHLEINENSIVALFYRSRYYKGNSAHIDVMTTDSGDILPTGPGINWVVGGGNSKMEWYEPPDNMQTDVKYNSVNRPYYSWPRSELIKVSEYPILSEPILVDVATPHGISCGTEDRWCFSLRFGKRLSWYSTVELLKENNMLIES
jgi:hypothetical protein